MYVCSGRYSGSAYQTLVEGTVRNYVSYVAQIFRDNNRSNPTKDSDGELGRFLQCFFRAFCNKDPKPKHQKSLPACVVREVKNTFQQRSIVQLENLSRGGSFLLADLVKMLLSHSQKIKNGDPHS